MTESSNYDEAANSSPQACGVWKQTGPRTFETKYVFHTTKAPGPGDGSPSGGEGTGAGTRIVFEASGDHSRSAVSADEVEPTHEPLQPAYGGQLAFA